MGDDEIRDHVRDALLEEPALATCTRFGTKDRLCLCTLSSRPPARSPSPSQTASSHWMETYLAWRTLQGIVPTPSEREIAEFDAWYVFGVDKVKNYIEVRA